ncbi:MAG TPA: hypothetical protein VNK23_00290 [Candidatus Dormibacteraeota bacterium]|nr:hypothetical protein [Candidatus Dormibacteraeota bacterium]
MDATLRLRTRPWIWPGLLSLDAPIVAVLWLLLFTRSLRVRVPVTEAAVLAMAVWLIYVADRIMDSFRESERAPLALRHRFYREHRAAFVAPFCGIMLLAAWMAWTKLDERTLRGGVALAAIVGVYFGVVHLSGSLVQRWFPKELAVAVLFCAGSCLPVFVRVRGLNTPDIAGFIGFVLVGWMNTALIEYTEWIALRDGGAEQPSALTIALARVIVPLGIAIAALSLIAVAFPSFRDVRPVLLAEAGSALALAALSFSWRRISTYVLRISADAVLCTPAVLLAVLAFLRR